METKPDRTPVTEVDRAVEEDIRARLGRARPSDAIVGEEFGSEGSGTRRWVIDPIDGTINFLRGVPIWGTLLALEVDGEMRVGVASAPALGRRWWAGRGAGAFADGARIHVSDVRTIDDALLCYTSGPSFDEYGLGEPFRSLAARCWSARGYSDFWGHVLVAEGSADAMVEPIVNLWDVAPIQVIVEEAGGRFTDLEGAARSDGGNALSSNGRLHDEVLEALRG